MSLYRLLLRPLRRYSTSSNPYPFHSTTTTTSPSVVDNNHQQQYHPPPPPTNNYHQQYHPPPPATTNNNHQQYQPPPPAATGNYHQQYQPPPPATTGNYNQYNNYNNNNNSHYPNAADQFSGTNFNHPNQYNNSNNYNPQSSPSATYNPQPPAAFPATAPKFDIQSSISSTAQPPQRSYGYSSAEEAAAERRRRKRRLRIEPPLYALRSNSPPTPPNPSDPEKPRLPDSTSALVGNRLNLHNRVQSLIRAGDLDAASYVARQSVFQYVRPTVFTCNAIIAAMYRAKRYNDAKALFQYFFRQFNIIPNVVSYNNLIVSHCESGEVEDALKAYEYIIENAPYSPSAVTYRHLTKGLIDAGRMDEAVSMLREMLNKGHGADSLVFNNVILGFLNLGNLEKANELFDELKERCTVYDGVVNATFMDWFFNQGKPKEAMESYRDLMSKNYRMVPATRNVLLETLLRHGKKKEAWDLFHDMLDDHTPPTFQAVNSDTLNMMVNECFKEGNVAEAVEVFKRSGKGLKSKPFQPDVAAYNNMMARMCELEMMEEAEQYYKQLCDKSLSPDVNTYRTLIDAYINVDGVDNMLEKYSKMVEAGLRVIPPYANKWFQYLIGKGKALDCLTLLSGMCDREPKPDVTTFDIVIRGLVEEGNYDGPATLVREMMNHGVGLSASLKEFVLDVFEKQGRRAEIENILRTSPLPPQRPYPPRSSPRPEMAGLGGRDSPMPWHTTVSPQVSYGNQFAPQIREPPMANQMTNAYPAGVQETEFPRMAGQSVA